MEHLENFQILVDYQHGFQKGRSCEKQLVITIEDIARHLNNKEQVDLLILDFSKAFDTVPHQRLCSKLEHYGIRGGIHRWIKTWLTERKQCVVVDGEQSEHCRVKSGVPQGTVLGPLMFLLYINDIGENINSKLRLFADDSLLYLAVSTETHCEKLQKDLDTLVNWAETWQMKFNAEKCYVLRITTNRKPIKYEYKMRGHILKAVEHNPYLGVELTNKLSWDNHINNIVSKASRSLGFLRRNLHKCPETIKKQAYIALVRPHLEYASSAWDPYYNKHINQLEMVQRRSARFIKRNYSREPGTVTKLMQELQLQPLQVRRKISKLTLLHKALHQKVSIPLPVYIQQPSRKTRQYHHRRFMRLGSSNDKYKYSFFPRTLTDWNNLPGKFIDTEDSEKFKASITSYFDTSSN